MKTNLSIIQRYIIIGYLAFVILAGAIYYFLLPLFNSRLNSNYNRQFLQNDIFFIASSCIFLFIITELFKKKLNKEIIINNENVHRYEALSSATNDAIWDYDIQSEKVYYNERLIEIFGYTKEELADNTSWWENNIHPEDRARVLKRMNVTLDSGKTNWEDEYQFRCKNGEYKIVYDRSYILRNESGKPIRLIGAMKDVTRLRTLEKDLINKQLKNKNILGKRIIVSHEGERKKIKNELQEDVNQILASIKLYINSYNAERKNDTITTSIRHLDDAMQKIKKISNTLFSSTFEIFGLREAIHEFCVRAENDWPIELHFESGSFEEEKVDKSISLLLYRIVEDKVSWIIEHIHTTGINISLSNNLNHILLNIMFKNMDQNSKVLLDDPVSMDIKSKLEMFDGVMRIYQTEQGYYCIEVIIQQG